MKTEPEFGEAFEDSGPGARLRQAREAAEMTVDNVAGALLLHPQTIEAIEADSFDHLPAPTFVRGYLRGYARVVGLPAGPILDLYDRRGFEPPPLDADIVDTPQAHTSDTAVRLVTYAVVALLVLLVGLWWHSQMDGGFGIAGGLFDWSPDASPDPSLPATKDAAAGAATVDGEAGGGPVAAAPGRTDELPQDDDPLATAPTEGPASGGIAAVEPAPDTTGEAGRGAIETARLQPDASSEDAESSIPAPAEDAAPGGIAVVASAPAEADVSGTTTNREALATPESHPQAEVEAEADADADAEAEVEADAGAGAGAEAEAEVEADTEAGADLAAGPDRTAETRSGDADGGDAPAPDGTGRADEAGESLPAVTPPAVPAAPSSETASTDTGAATVETSQSGLVLEFRYESWVEVYDRERTRLFFGLVQPGRVLGFDGAQPFDVLLGSGEDVRVRIDGEAFDHKPYMRHGVARFSVGSAPEGDGDAAESSGTTATDAAASLADAVASPTDAGVSPADTDASPADTDASPTDTDTSPADTTASPADADASPADTDASPTDTDASPADAAASPAETTDASPTDAVASPAESSQQQGRGR